jgi:hypothetical protein
MKSTSCSDIGHGASKCVFNGGCVFVTRWCPASPGPLPGRRPPRPRRHHALPLLLRAPTSWAAELILFYFVRGARKCAPQSRPFALKECDRERHAGSRRCGAQRVASPDSTPKSFVWNVWRVPSGWGAGGRVAGDAHAARRRGHISAHVRMCARAQVGSAAPLPAAAYAHASFTGRARRVRSARTNGVQMRGEVLRCMRAGACPPARPAR